MATYQQIADWNGTNQMIGRMMIAVARAQDAKQKEVTFPANAGEKEWANRDPRAEADRIQLFILNTAPVTAKLDTPGTITDADLQSAVNTLVPALVKGA